MTGWSSRSIDHVDRILPATRGSVLDAFSNLSRVMDSTRSNRTWRSASRLRYVRHVRTSTSPTSTASSGKYAELGTWVKKIFPPAGKILNKIVWPARQRLSCWHFSETSEVSVSGWNFTRFSFRWKWSEVSVSHWNFTRFTTVDGQTVVEPVPVLRFGRSDGYTNGTSTKNGSSCLIWQVHWLSQELSTSNDDNSNSTL
jgi:hypothetical protein